MISGLGGRLTQLLRRPPRMYPTDDTSAMQRRGMAMLWTDTIFSAISGAFYGDFVAIFLLALGAPASIFGLRSSLNSAVALAAPFVGAWLVERTGKRKLWVLLFPGGLSRLTLLATAFVPFLFHGEAGVTAFVLLVAVQAFSDSLAAPGFNSLLGDILPVRIRGRYLGARLMVSSIARVAVVPLAGWMIRLVGGIPGYQVAWLLAAAAGFVATSFYARIPEPPSLEGRRHADAPKANLREDMRLLLSDRRFVFFCGINFIWNLGISFAGPFFSVHMVQDLGFGVDTVALLATIATLASIVAYRFTGELVDRFGAPRMVMISMLTVPLMPFLWTLAQTPLQVSMVQIYGNLAWSGFHVASTPLLLAICPPERRARYFAIFNTINGLATVLGPIPGTWAYTTWGFTAIGIMSALGRATGGLLFLLFLSTGWLKDIPGGRRARQLAAEPIAENTEDAEGTRSQGSGDRGQGKSVP